MTEENSRKRPFDGQSDNYTWNKRSNSHSSIPTLKILVPYFMAGKLIGKGGSQIGELKTKFKLTVRVSSSRVCYPGTRDRMVCVSGDVANIIEFLYYLISEVEEELQAETVNKDLSPDIRLVVSHVAAGLVIGKGGVQIKKIVSDSDGARVSLSNKEESVTGERILTVSGNCQQRTAACKLVMETMAEAPDKISTTIMEYKDLSPPMYTANNVNPVQNISSMYNSQAAPFYSNPLRNGAGAVPTPSIQDYRNDIGNLDYQPMSRAKVTFQAQVEIPERLVGTILGKGGHTIMEFGRNSGARLRFSNKDEFAEGTTDRILTISGGMSQVQKAYKFVDAKLSEEYGIGVNSTW